MWDTHLERRQRPTEHNDLPNVLSAVSDPDNVQQLQVDYHIDNKSTIEENGGSLWIYDYIESLPPQRNIEGSLEKLERHIEPSGIRLNPSDSPDKEFNVLGISNSHGVFMNEVKQGREFKQDYTGIEAQTGDFVYNPHRVDVGSIGIVPLVEA